MLRLVDAGDLDDTGLIERLGAWRAASMPNYPTQFQVTRAGTRRWLSDLVLGDADRLMFLVVDPDAPRGPAFGHLGFDHADAGGRFIHLSNVVSGDRERLPPGAMEVAERRMLEWAYATLGVSEVRARIFTDNRPARRLHERLGFQEIGRIGLRRHTEPGRVVFLPCAAGDDAPPDRWWVELAERPDRR